MLLVRLLTHCFPSCIFHRPPRIFQLFITKTFIFGRKYFDVYVVYKSWSNCVIFIMWWWFSLIFFVFLQALGCLLYMLCYMEHPFEDGAKLRILNAKFMLPEFDKDYSIFHSLICGYFFHQDFPVINAVTDLAFVTALVTTALSWLCVHFKMLKKQCHWKNFIILKLVTNGFVIKVFWI